MLVACPACKAKFKVDDARVSERGLKLRCSKCATVFSVSGQGQAAAQQGEVPLPGAPGAGAVPLPGGPSGASSGAVPLPGGASEAYPDDPPIRSGGDVPLPGRAGGADPVPLPGAVAEAEPPGGFDDDFDVGEVPLPGTGEVSLPGSAPKEVPLPGTGAAASDYDPFLDDLPPAGPPPGARAPAPAEAPPPGPPPGARVTEAPPEGPPPGGRWGDPQGEPDVGDLSSFMASSESAQAGFDPFEDGDAAPASEQGDFGNVDLDPGAQADDDFDPFADLDLAGRAPPPPGGAGDLPSPGSSGALPPPLPGQGDDEVLDFIDEGGSAAAAPTGRYRVRRRSGKTFGPFDADVVISMLREGQLLGNEEVSPDGSDWQPLSSVPVFAEALSDLEAAPAAPPPPVLEADPGEGISARRGGRRSGGGRRALVGALLLLLVLAGGGAAAFYWGGDALLAYIPGLGGAQGPGGADATSVEALERPDWESHRQALAAAEGALVREPDDPATQAGYARVVYTLQARYGRLDAQVAKADRFMTTLTAEAGDLPEVQLAALARAVLRGGGVAARAAVKPLATTPAARRLMALSLLKDGDAEGALGWADRALEARPDDPLLLHLKARALLARGAPEDRTEAVALLERAAPADPAAVITRADLALDADPPALEVARALLEGLPGEGLSPTHAGKAAYLRGRLHRLAGDAEAARAAYEEAVERLPSDSEGRGVYGRWLLERGEPGAAVPHLQAAAAGGDTEAVALHVEALIGAGKVLDATQALEGAAGRLKDEVRLQHLKGLLAERKGEADAAETFFRGALEADPTYYPASLALGDLLREQGALSAAQAPLEAAVEAAPEVPEVHTALGQWLLAMDRPEPARQAFDRALALDEAEAEAWLGLARARVALSDEAGAQAAFDRARALDAELPGLELYYGSWRHQAGDLERASEALGRAHEQAPEDPLILARLAAVDLARSEPAKAEKEARRAVSLDPGLAEAHYVLGRALTGQGALREASTHLEAAIRLEPGRAAHHYALGQAHEVGRDWEEAVEAYQAATRLDAGMIEAWKSLGDVLQTITRFRAAEAAYEQALALAPGQVEVLAALGDTARRAGRLAQAVKWYEQAARAKGAPPEGMLFAMARAYDDLGRKDRAEKAYLASLKSAPSDPSPHYYLGYIYKDRRDRARAGRHFEAFLKQAGKDHDLRPEVEDELYYLKR